MSTLIRPALRPAAVRAARWPALATATLAIAAAALVPLDSAQALDLRVEVRQVQPGTGPVMGALYAESDPWMKTPRQGLTATPVTDGGPTVLVFRDLPAGRYALSLYQDLNGNGVLDRNPLGIPREPYGFSRDAMGRMGPPSFGDAAVEVKADTTVVITLR
jgi:uncharacterized protein (DUF2141 family)